MAGPIIPAKKDKSLFAMTLNLNEMQPRLIARITWGFASLLILVLTIATLFQYKGHIYIYLLFSVVSNILLYCGFRRNAIFFDTFIGVFFWLGFWLKLTVRVCFTAGLFHEAVGDFDGSGAAFDHALLVTTCGLTGLLIASFVREKLIFKYPEKLKEDNQNGLSRFYIKYRTLVLTGFVISFLVIALTNIYLGIYQKGAITQTTLPFGLNGIYKWLLLFGLASFSAVILKCELSAKKEFPYLVVILSMLESFSTNVSLLSRGMILNVAALAYGLYTSLKLGFVKLRLRFVVTISLMFVILFMSSVFAVNYMRSSAFQSLTVKGGVGVKAYVIGDLIGENINHMTKPLFLDRWVGIEGVMAVTTSKKVGWSLWHEAWEEKYSESTTSFYDKTLITSPYIHTDFTKHHHISMPGILAFLFYPGSFPFLFTCMFVLGLIAALIEMSVFKLGGNNLILCSLMAQVIAYRFASFGYAPIQTYLIFGALYLNLFVIYFVNKCLLIWHGK